MKAVKKFERGGYKFTATLNEDYTCEIVSDDISVEDGGFISNWAYLYTEEMLFQSIDIWIMRESGKTKDEIDFALTARKHGFEIIEDK